MRAALAIFISVSLAAGSLVTSPSGAHSAEIAAARLVDRSGTPVGHIVLRQTPHGVLLRTDLKNIPKGWHGFHINGIGRCKPNFGWAGRHFNPGNKNHGLRNRWGHHAGDMPNIYAGADGIVKIEALNTHISLKRGAKNIFDSDGAAIIIHDLPDTHHKSSSSGAKIACGVIRPNVSVPTTLSSR